jgi:hypothetical protein
MVTSSLHVLFMTPCLFVIVEDIKQYRRRKSLKAAETQVTSEVL